MRRSTLRPRWRTGLVGGAAASLIAASLWAVPGAGAAEDPGTDSPTSSSQTSEPEAEPAPSPEPTPTASPELSPSPNPAPSPSLSPSPGETSPSETPADPSVSPSESVSPSPTETPSPTVSPTVDEEGTEDDYIVVVRNGAYIDSVKNKAEEIGGRSDKELRGAVDGFTAKLTEEDVEELEKDPNVKYVEKDEIVRIAGAVSGFVDCDANTLGRVDDSGAGPVSLGFNVDWFGTEYSSIYINNNGGFVFNDGAGPFTAYRNVDLSTATRPYVLPLFTDIDTRYSSGQVTYGPLDNSNPSAGFCINWVNVGEWGSSGSDYSFQVILTNKGAGDLDLEFNYDTISTPSNAYNPTFEAGFAVPTDPTETVTIADSAESASTVRNRLVGTSYPSSCTVAGRHIYEIAYEGDPTPPDEDTPTDEPSSNPTPEPTQTDATWGLARIDDDTTSWTDDDTYVSPGTYGTDVVAYVVDTGIRYTHDDFTGRASSSGIDTIDSDGDPSDCNGHGTHVAGTIGGVTYGVAKDVTLVGVRVLNCFGSGSVSSVVNGLNQIASFHATNYPGKRAVVNMSLGGGKSTSIDTAVRDLVTEDNIPVVVAAGNSNDDAQFYSPAGESEAITVAASTSSDAKASYSNYGSVVDVYAPGSAITAPWYTSDTAINTISGTSMASPHVAGAAALYLALNSGTSAAAVETALTSTANVVDSAISGSPSGTTSDLLYVGGYGTFSSGIAGRSTSVLPAAAPAPLSPIVAARNAIELQCTSRDSGGSPAPPASPPSGGGGGGGSSGGGSSSKPSAGGGGGGLNEVTTIVPTNSGAPGSTIALAGWGLETTRDVKFNDVSAQFTVVSGGQVDVVVPDVPPGVYVVHAVLAPTVGRASFWEGFSVLEGSAGATPSASSGTPVVGKPADVVAGTQPAAEFVAFTGNKTKMTRATRSKLAEIAETFDGADDEVMIVTYTNKNETKKFVRRATKRAANMRRYLTRAGFEGTVSVRTEPGDTKVQRRGAMIYVEPDGASAASEPEGVNSVIVRLKKGRSPQVEGEVRGADNVASGLGDSLRLGRYLGLRMYEIRFAEPVSESVAERVAEALMDDPGIAFAEPDSIVSAQTSVAS